MALSDPAQIVPDVPPAADVRLRLAVNYTEADLLRRLLRLAERREREAERLGLLLQPREGVGNGRSR